MKIIYNNFEKYHKCFLNKIGKSIVIALIAIIILLNSPYISAQIEGVTINVQQLDIAANLWHLEDLINMVSIEYNGEEDLKICLVATITNIDGNPNYICIKGENYLLSPKPFPQPVISGNFGNIKVTSDNEEYKKYVSDVALRTGSLPAGTYKICVEAYEMTECICNGTDNCVEQEIFSPSPPELIFPTDESEISEELPLFSWLPPMPSYGMETYKLQIVEINDGQSPIEAMEANSLWFFKEGIKYNSYQLNIAEREFVSGQRYAWRVSASIDSKGTVGNNAIVESSVWSFKFSKLNNNLNVISDPNFNAACKLVKDFVDIKEKAKIYGVINPIPEGATIESEVISDFEKMKIENEPFLFIIDEEPGERFGHPVHYVLADTEFNTVKVYDANWWPVVRHSIERIEEVGDANIEGLVMTLTKLTKQPNSNKNKTGKTKITNNKPVLKPIDIPSTVNCSKWILILEGGDYDRLLGKNNGTENVSIGSSKAKSLEEIYKKKGFEILHYSQSKTDKNNNLKSLPVDEENHSAAITIQTLLDTIKTVYIANNCCSNSVPNLEVGIYIWANALQNTSKFKVYDKDTVYTHDEKIAFEDIDYSKDILSYLINLDPCVNLTLFDVGDCFTGNMTAKQILKSDIVRLENRGTLKFTSIKELQ